MSEVPDALRIADEVNSGLWANYMTRKEAAAEIRRLYTENQTLQSEAAENARIIGASAETELALRARVEELERELAAIGAGGVEPLRKRAAPMLDMTPPATSRDRWMYEQGRLAERDARTPGSVAVAAPVVSDEQIKAVFLANGFTIKPGCDDLKPYVYKAARALLAASAEFAAQQTQHGLEPVDPVLKMLRDQEAKKAAQIAKGICPTCNGEGECGGQFTGGEWVCEDCNGSGRTK